MTAVSMTPTDAADLADLLRCLHDWIDAEEDQLNPLLDKHGYDLVGLRISLERHTVLLTTTTTRDDDGEPPF